MEPGQVITRVAAQCRVNTGLTALPDLQKPLAQLKILINI
jgi:hypothetical protein